MARNTIRTLLWIAWSLCVGGQEAEQEVCSHPPVPAGATYRNVTGGLGQPDWTVRYICDNGYELFGEEKLSCQEGTWRETENLPLCAVNIAKYKPASASSVAGEGWPSNAVDGIPTIVHEGRKCTETKSEKSPWWTVDLLKVQYPTSRLSLRLPVSQLAWWRICLSPGPSVPIQVQTCRPEARNCLANCHSQPLILSSLTLDCNEISLYSLQFASFRVPAHARLDLPKAVKHIRITTRCCDDLPIKNVEIRVGNSTTYKDNPLCNWLPGSLKEGDTILVDCPSDNTAGRYVSLMITGSNTVLSVCEVEVFSPHVLGTSSCSPDIDRKQLAFYDDSCFWFVNDVLKENQSRDILGFTEASQTCDAIGYRLADEIDKKSASFIKSRLEAEGRAGSGTMVWIGAIRDPDGGKDTWQWMGGSTVREIFWGSGQPNNYNNEQNCAVLDSELDWRWNDLSCKVDAVTVCRGGVSRCPAPPVNVGTWYSGNLTVGSTIQYHCPVGYRPVGQATQVCKGTGQWSGEPISCQYVDCKNVAGLLNGAVHVIDGRTTWGARVKYECNPDYSLMEGDEGRVCEAGGWTGTAPQCRYTRCPEPAIVNNAKLKEIPSAQGKNRLGAKVIYTCEEGHVARGSLSRECLLGGQWSGSQPTCQFVDCGQPPDLLHGSHELTDGRTTYGAQLRFSCGDDYNLKGETRLQCEANGKWTRARTECEIIKCPAPRAPNGGRVSGYNYEVHRRVEYSCLPGHMLVGDPVLECLRSGDWSNNPPRCKYIDCGKLADIDGGKVHYSNGTTHLGSHVEFKCSKHYHLDGAKQVVCQENAKWSAALPTCTEIRCTIPPRPNNTVVSISARTSTDRLVGTSLIRSRFRNNTSYGVGTVLKYRCERGFLLEGGDRVVTRLCGDDGSWTGNSPSCSYVDCGLPEIVSNGEFKLQNNGTSYGAIAFYECQTGFILKGFDRRSCKAEGKWEPASPKCEETLCPALVTSDKAIMNLTTLRIGGKATFSCEHGYKVVGDNDITCLSSGSWSGWPPACVEIDCGTPLTVDNSRQFLVNDSTKYGAQVEYHCSPGYNIEGPFRRLCEITGRWSGSDPVCYTPSQAPVNTHSAGGLLPYGGSHPAQDDRETDNSNIGVWIGVALGLIIVLGIIMVGIYFYRKQMQLQQKPSRDNNGNGPGVLGIPSYVAGPYAGNTSQIGTRPPPPIQMYSIDDTPEDHRGPIYDTINDDNSSHSHSSYSQSNSDNAPYTRSTFNPVTPLGLSSDSSVQYNGGYSNDYDIPEGNERLTPTKIKNSSQSSVGVVTINGIAV